MTISHSGLLSGPPCTFHWRLVASYVLPFLQTLLSSQFFCWMISLFYEQYITYIFTYSLVHLLT